jgi:hypothetical protein
MVSLSIVKKLGVDFDQELETSNSLKGRVIAPYELNYLEIDSEIN